MSGEPTLEELLEVQAFLGLPSPALVEKDFHVVRALAAIAALDTTPLRLIFGRGTSLSRAYRLVRRMSEDIDLRIVAGQGAPPRGALRRLRTAVTQALLDAGFNFDPEDRAYRVTDNQSRRTVYYLPYPSPHAGRRCSAPDDQDRDGGMAAKAARCRSACQFVHRGSDEQRPRDRQYRVRLAA